MAVMELGMVSEVTSSPFRYRCCAMYKGLAEALLLKDIPHHAAKSEICTAVSPEQPSKAELPMLVTELGIVTDARPVQLVKAYLSIFVTEFPIAIEVRPLQREKAYIPILVTEFGIVTDVRLVHP